MAIFEVQHSLDMNLDIFEHSVGNEKKNPEKKANYLFPGVQLYR